MVFKNAYIPYGGYWSTPFCRWQGSFADQHAIRFAAEITTRFLQEKNIPVGDFDGLILGTTVPQISSFYGTPWLAGMIGADITGPMIGQACATSAKAVELAAASVSAGSKNMMLTVCADRCSNGPHLVYPNPNKPGATQEVESWVWDNFGKDPWARNAMIDTAENVAKEMGISKEEQDEVTFIRYNQYTEATKDDRAFQKRYMIAPIEIKNRKGKVLATVEGDEGVFPTTPEGLAKLRPVYPEGTVSFGTQTFPGDGNTGIIVCNKEMAEKYSTRDDVEIEVISMGEAKVEKGYMAKAIVPAADRALEAAGIKIEDCAAIKTHTPFAVNDVYFCKNYGLEFDAMNNYGTSLIYGHPQGPTGQRLMCELFEEMVDLGGGYALFDGCAAGDTGLALVFKVTLK
jgi:acetyl-CoA acetyltransferase